MHLIHAVKKRFNGSIFVLGPTPRHILKCCDDPTHLIKDEIGVKADMMTYIEVFSEQLRQNLPLPADTYYVDFRQIFGDSFGAGSLVEHVHLEDGPCRVLANFLLRGHEILLPAPQTDDDGDVSFADALQAAEIIVPAEDKDAGEQEADDFGGYNFDDLDFEG